MKQRNVLVISFILATLLLNFQNCAPAVAPDQVSANDEVRIIDDWAKAEIQFATTGVVVDEEENSAIVSGLCNRKYNHAQLRWAVWLNDGSKMVMIGDSECRSGQFAFDMSNLATLDCGVHRLVVEGEWGGSAYTQLEKICHSL